MIVQTVSRYFPIETHTKIPFIHFLPNKIYRKIYSLLGFKYQVFEENLNLPHIKILMKYSLILKM